MMLAHSDALPWLKWQSSPKQRRLAGAADLGAAKTQMSLDRFYRRLIMIAERQKTIGLNRHRGSKSAQTADHGERPH